MPVISHAGYLRQSADLGQAQPQELRRGDLRPYPQGEAALLSDCMTVVGRVGKINPLGTRVKPPHWRLGLCDFVYYQHFMYAFAPLQPGSRAAIFANWQPAGQLCAPSTQLRNPNIGSLPRQ